MTEYVVTGRPSEPDLLALLAEYPVGSSVGGDVFSKQEVQALVSAGAIAETSAKEKPKKTETQSQAKTARSE